jgi:hypothetical protein
MLVIGGCALGFNTQIISVNKTIMDTLSSDNPRFRKLYNYFDSSFYSNILKIAGSVVVLSGIILLIISICNICSPQD